MDKASDSSQRMMMDAPVERMYRHDEVLTTAARPGVDDLLFENSAKVLTALCLSLAPRPAVLGRYAHRWSYVSREV